MTEIRIDNQLCEPSSDSTGTVRDLVQVLKPRLGEHHRMIIGITCDDQHIADEQLQATLDADYSTYGKIEFCTASVPELATEALEEAEQLIAQTRQLQQATVESLENNQQEEAIAALRSSIEAMAQAHEVVWKTIHLDELTLKLVGENGTVTINTLNHVANQLTQIKSCLQTQDFVLLNDVLKYEIDPAMKEWQELITQMTETLKPYLSSPVQDTSSDS